MVIERPVGLFGPNFSSPVFGDFGGERRKLSRGAWIAIGVSVALHVAGGTYLYLQRTALPALLAPDPGHVTTVARVKLSDLLPPKPETQPKIVHVHDPLTPPDTVAKAPFPPQKPQTTPDSVEGPPVIAQTLVKPVDPQVTTAPLAQKAIRNPTWLERPNADQLAQYYPPRALELGKTGTATLDCVVSARGGLTRCTVASENPGGWNFGEAAQKLSRYFKMSPKTEDGVPVGGGTISVVIRFNINN